MKIIGKMIGGEIETYEVVGFRYYVDEKGKATINCIISGNNVLVIKGIKMKTRILV